MSPAPQDFSMQMTYKNVNIGNNEESLELLDGLANGFAEAFRHDLMKRPLTTPTLLPPLHWKCHQWGAGFLQWVTKNDL